LYQLKYDENRNISRYTDKRYLIIADLDKVCENDESSFVIFIFSNCIIQIVFYNFIKVKNKNSITHHTHVIIDQIYNSITTINVISVLLLLLLLLL